VFFYTLDVIKPDGTKAVKHVITGYAKDPRGWTEVTPPWDFGSHTAYLKRVEDLKAQAAKP